MADAKRPSPPLPPVAAKPCPTSARRALLTDEEWEADVAESLARLAGLTTAEYDPEDDAPDPPAVTAYDTPCAVCGATSPCMYDPNGLPLIHADEDATDG